MFFVINKNKLNRRIKAVGTVIRILLILATSVVCFMNPYRYETDIMVNGNKYRFDDTYKAYLDDDKYGKTEILYSQGMDEYYLHAVFKKEGKTKITLEDADGNKKIYELEIKIDTYKISE